MLPRRSVIGLSEVKSVGKENQVKQMKDCKFHKAPSCYISAYEEIDLIALTVVVDLKYTHSERKQLQGILCKV